MKSKMPTQVSKNVVNKPVITGKSARGINPGAVAQLGGVYGSHITDRPGTDYAGEPYLVGKNPAGGNVVLGNQKALDVKGGGPGTGRQVMARGSQGCYGEANPGSPAPGANKPIFPGFK